MFVCDGIPRGVVCLQLASCITVQTYVIICVEEEEDEAEEQNRIRHIRRRIERGVS